MAESEYDPPRSYVGKLPNGRSVYRLDNPHVKVPDCAALLVRRLDGTTETYVVEVGKKDKLTWGLDPVVAVPMSPGQRLSITELLDTAPVTLAFV